jgi:hypothetical protein
MSRYCKFCKQYFDEDDKSHWIPNGKNQKRCRAKKFDYSLKNKEKSKKAHRRWYEQNIGKDKQRINE